jgi:hypothetical protein
VAYEPDNGSKPPRAVPTQRFRSQLTSHLNSPIRKGRGTAASARLLLPGGRAGSRRGWRLMLPAVSPLRVVSIDGQRIEDLAGPERWRPFVQH